MKTHEQARADAQERANAMHAAYVVYRDLTAVPPFCFGCCSRDVWARANISHGMLSELSVVEPEPKT